MSRIEKTVYLADDLTEVLYQLNNVTNLQIIAGGTAISSVKENSLCIGHVSELTCIEKHERFIDLGSSVTLNQIIDLGRENIPPVLFDATETIANTAIRNMATIGGNICAEGCYHTLWAPLISLDARLEVKTKKETLIYPMNKLPGIDKGSILTKIRIPLDEWEIEIFKKLGPSNYITEDSASFVFLANTQKDIISNVRIAFAGSVLFHSHELENKLMGTRLPLTADRISAIIRDAEKIFAGSFSSLEPKTIVRDQFINLLEMSLLQLI